MVSSCFEDFDCLTYAMQQRQVICAADGEADLANVDHEHHVFICAVI